MNDENNPIIPEGEEGAGEAALDEAKLNEELEALRDTFQEKYDESVDEANNGPVIQELEEGEPEEEENGEEAEEEQTSFADKKPKKKKKVGKIIAITIPVLLVLVVIGSLLAYVVASMTNPNFSSFVSTYAKATASTEYDEKIGYLEEALKFCSDKDSVFQQAMANTLLEEIVVATYNEEGYAAAYAYMQSKMTEEQIENPANKDFRKIVSVIDKVNKLSLTAFEKVMENIGDKTETPSAEELAKGLSVPDEVKETVYSALVAFADGYLLNKNADSITKSLTSMNYYADAYSALTSIGADSRELAEKLCVDLYKNGFIIEAVSLSSVAVNPENEVIFQDYSKMLEDIDAYSEIEISILDLANKALSEGKTDDADIEALVKNRAELSDEKAEIICSFVKYAIETIETENGKNLTEASTAYATLSSLLEAFGMEDISVYLKTAEIIFASGNISDAETLITTYLTDEAMAAATAEQKASRDNMVAVIDAFKAVSDVFSPYYSTYYQSGTMDYNEVKTALEKLITDDADDYTKGFVYYCLYFASKYSETDVDALKLVEKMEKHIPDLVFMYGYYYIDEYLADNKFEAAKKSAEKLLDKNIADEYANSVIALVSRVNGDLDASIDAALKGIELSGSSAYCAKQLAIAYILKGDFDAAYGYASGFYNNNMSIDSCDLMLVLNKVYEGTDEETKKALESAASEIEQTYSYYGVSSYKDTLAILSGEKTVGDVFNGGNFDLSDD